MVALFAASVVCIAGAAALPGLFRLFRSSQLTPSLLPLRKTVAALRSRGARLDGDTPVVTVRKVEPCTS